MTTEDHQQIIQQHPWRNWSLRGSRDADQMAMNMPFYIENPSLFWVKLPTNTELFQMDQAWLIDLLATIAATPRHNYIIESARPDFFRWWLSPIPADAILARAKVLIETSRHDRKMTPPPPGFESNWLSTNIWAATRLTDRLSFKSYLRSLLSCPTRKRILVFRPCEFQVKLTSYFFCRHCHGEGVIKAINAKGYTWFSSTCLYCDGTKIPLFMREKLHWVFLGTTVRSQQGSFVLRECDRLGIPAYVEQLGTWFKGLNGKSAERDPDGSVMEEWPDKLRIRKLPEGLLPVGWVAPAPIILKAPTVSDGSSGTPEEKAVPKAGVKRKRTGKKSEKVVAT